MLIFGVFGFLHQILMVCTVNDSMNAVGRQVGEFSVDFIPDLLRFIVRQRRTHHHHGNDTP